MGEFLIWVCGVAVGVAIAAAFGVGRS